jgi:hypothetical protein
MKEGTMKSELVQLMLGGHMDIEERLARIEDIEAIKCLKARYFEICDDDHNPDRVVELFVGHGSWRGRGFEASGRPAIHQLFSSFQGLVSETQHAGVNPQIDVEGDHARGVWYSVGVFKFRDGGQQQLLSARYDDTYVKVDGEWKLEHLRIELRVSIDLAPGTSPLPEWART